MRTTLQSLSIHITILIPILLLFYNTDWDAGFSPESPKTTSKSTVLADSGRVFGTFYLDGDNNCIQDTLSVPLAHYEFYLLESSSLDTTVVRTNENGYYEIRLPFAQYIIKHSQEEAAKHTCTFVNRVILDSTNREAEYSNLFICTYDLSIEYNYPDTFRVDADTSYFIELKLIERSGIKASGLNLHVLSPFDIDSVDAPSGIFKNNTRNFKQSEEFDILPNDSLVMKLYFSTKWADIIGRERIKLDIRIRNSNETICLGKYYEHLKEFRILPPYYCRPFYITNKRQEEDDIFRVKCGKQDTAKYYFNAWKDINANDFELIVEKDPALTLQNCNFNYSVLDSANIQVSIPDMLEDEEYTLEMVFAADCNPEEVTSIPSTISLNISAFSDNCLTHYDTNYYSYKEQAWIYGDYYDIKCSSDRHICEDTSYVILDSYQRDTFHDRSVIQNPINRSYPILQRRSNIQINILNSDPEFEPNVAIYRGYEPCGQQLDAESPLYRNTVKNSYRLTDLPEGELNIYYTYNPNIPSPCTIQVIQDIDFNNLDVIPDVLDIPQSKWARGLYYPYLGIRDHELGGTHIQSQIKTIDSTIAFIADSLIFPLKEIPQQVTLSASLHSESGKLCIADSGAVSWQVSEPNFNRRLKVQGTLNIRRESCQNGPKTPLPEYQVLIHNGTDYFTTYTNLNGTYELSLPPSDYIVSIPALDTIIGFNPCRNTQIINVLPVGNPIFETDYLKDQSCPYLDVRFHSDIAEVGISNRFSLDLEFSNRSTNTISAFEAPFTFIPNVKIVSITPNNTTILNDQAGTFKIPKLIPGETSTFNIWLQFIDSRDYFNGWGEISIDLEETIHCFSNNKVSRYFNWKDQHERPHLYSSQTQQNDIKKSWVHLSMGEDEIDSRNMNLISVNSNREINPSSIHLLRNGVNCSVVEYSNSSPMDLNIIHDCLQPTLRDQFVGAVFECNNCTQLDLWEVSASAKENFGDFSTTPKLSIVTPYNHEYMDTSGNHWHTAPIICDGNSGKYLRLLPNPGVLEKQTIIDCYGDEEEIPYPHWVGFIGNGDRIEVTIDSLSNCWTEKVEFGILEGHPNRWKWITCQSVQSYSNGRFSFVSEENLNYYIIIKGVPEITCSLPLFTLQSTSSFENKLNVLSQQWSIQDSLFTGGTIGVCLDSIYETYPRIKLTIEDSIYTNIDTFGCFRHIISGTDNISFALSQDYGILESDCKELMVFSDTIKLERPSDYIQFNGQLSVWEKNNCSRQSRQAYHLPEATLLLEGKRHFRIVTDDLGKWEMLIPKDNYNVGILPFDGELWELCSQNQTIDIRKDTTISIGIDPLSICVDTMIVSVIGQPQHYLHLHPFTIDLNIEKSKGDILSEIIIIRVDNGVEILSANTSFDRISSSEIAVPIHLTQSVENMEFGIEVASMDSSSNSFTLEVNAEQINCENFTPLLQSYRSINPSHCYAELICEPFSADTLTFNMNNQFPTPNLCFGVGIPHNLKWYKFITVDTLGSIIISFDPLKCPLLQGIQSGILVGSCNSNVVLDCHASCNTSRFTLSGNFESDNVYYLWIDGCNGDECEFNIEFNLPIVCNEIYFGDKLKVLKTDLCNTKIIRLSPPNNNTLGKNTWVVNGDTSNGTTLSIMDPQVDTLNVKLFGSRQIQGGPFVFDTICDTIIVDTFNQSSGIIEGQITRVTHCDSTSSIPLPGVNITFQSPNHSTQVQTDSLGKYSTCLYKGSYMVFFEGNNLSNFEPCPVQIFTIQTNDSLTKDFKLRQDSCQPIRTKISGLSRFRCNGPERELELNISNQSLGIFMPPPLLVNVDTFVSIEQIIGVLVDSVDILNAHEALIYFKNLDPGKKAKAEIRVSPNCDEKDVGQHFCIQSYFSTPVKNCFKDTTVHYCSIIRNSYDPNDLQAFPIGETEEHYIENQIWIEYLLRYQNQGTDTAFNISIDHLFSDPFDPSSFQLIESSFAGLRTYIDTDHSADKIVFELPNIDLLDDKTNEPASHGYVRYRLKMDSLPELYRHSSYADIFFDYNPAIRTNTVYHTITTDYFFSSDTLELCVGDSFNDWTFRQDTIVHDTLVIPGPDSIQSYVVRVEPDRHNEIDTSICPGTIVVFEGRSLFAEDTYYFPIEISEFCDSLVIVNLTHKNYTEVHVDTTIVAGGSFMGINIDKDTTFYQFTETSDSCIDQYYHIKVVTSTRTVQTSDYQVYPNPVDNTLYITVKGDNTKDLHSFQIFSTYGNIVEQDLIQELPKKLDLSETPKGVYYLKLIERNGVNYTHIFTKL